MILDTNSTVWNFSAWGRPYRLVSLLLDCSSPEMTPIQIERAASFSAILTRSGDVLAQWFGVDRYNVAMAKLDKDKSTRAVVLDGETVIPCHTWEVEMDPVKLPCIPSLPDLQMTGLPEEERRKKTKLIKITSIDHSLIGLTNKGHVLKIDGLASEHSICTWRYVSENTRVILLPSFNRDTQLPNFSEIGEVKKHPAFHATTGNGGEEKPPQVELLSDTMLITHVSDIASKSSKFYV